MRPILRARSRRGPWRGPDRKRRCRGAAGPMHAIHGVVSEHDFPLERPAHTLDLQDNRGGHARAKSKRYSRPVCRGGHRRRGRLACAARRRRRRARRRPCARTGGRGEGPGLRLPDRDDRHRHRGGVQRRGHHTQVTGTIEKIGFVEGQTVHPGSLIAQLDPRPYQAALQQAEANLARDQAHLANAQANLGRYAAAGEAGLRDRRSRSPTRRATVSELKATIASDKAADLQCADAARLHDDHLADRRRDRHPPGRYRQYRPAGHRPRRS